jgi:hypothetical protein
MNTPATHPTVRSSALPCRPSGTLAVMLFAAACALAACDPGPVDTPVAEPVRVQPVTRTPLLSRAVPEPWYVGDEYADVQQALQRRTDEVVAPTF